MKNYKIVAEEASKKYIQNGVPMNDTITKMAMDRGFNKHEIERVVEQANQVTYLSLFDAGRDKYASVNFELAKADEINNSIRSPKVKHATYLDDYKLPKEETEKVAEEKGSPISIWQQRSQLTKQALDLKKRGGENRVKFEKALNKFATIARREVITNKVSFEELNSVFPQDFVEKVAELYAIPGHEKTALEKESFCVNEQHPLAECYKELSDLEDEYIELHKEARELHNTVVKTAETPNTVKGAGSLIDGIAKDIAKAWNVIKEVPAKHLVGYPAAFLLGVVYQKSKEDKVTLTGDDVPLIYRAY